MVKGIALSKKWPVEELEEWTSENCWKEKGPIVPTQRKERREGGDGERVWKFPNVQFLGS